MNTYLKKILSLTAAIFLAMSSCLSLVSADNLTVGGSGEKAVKEGSFRLAGGEKITAEENGYFRVVNKEKVIWPQQGDSGTVSSVITDTEKESGKTYTKTAYTLPAPEKGMIWKLDVKKEAGESVTAGEKKYVPYSVTASQERITYSIVYDANGGMGSAANTEVSFGQTAVLSDGSGFTCTGKKLTGWNTDPAGKGTSYGLGAVYQDDGKIADGGEVRLYAIWEEEAPVNAEKPQISISGGGTFQTGDKALLEVKAGVSDGGTLSYQWYQSSDGKAAEGTVIDGAVSAAYQPSTEKAGTFYYYCVVTNTNDSVNGEKTAQAVSDAVSVTVEDPEPEPEIVNAQTPVIEWISGGGTFQTGDKALLEVKAGVSDGGTLSYQWYQSSDGKAAEGTAIDGAVSAAYQPSTEKEGTFYYYCVVTNTNDSVNGEKTAQAVSDAVSVTVNEKIPAVTDAEKPKVSGPSGSGTYYESDNFKLQVKASVGDGGTLTYQWYNNKEKIEGARQAEYKPSVGTGYYYCVVVNINQNASGEKTAYTASDAVKVTVKEGNRPRAADTPEVSGPSGGGTYYKGQSPRLEVKASVDDGGTLTYQWYKNTKNSNENGTLIQGATSSTYQPSTKTVGTVYYYCVVSNTNEEASETRTVRYVTGTAKISVIEKGSVKNNVKRASPISRNNRTTATKTRASNARTEDENNVMLLLFLMLGAGGTAAGLILRRRFRRQD